MVEPTKLRVVELRRELMDRNLETSGKKIELISRLQFALDKERRENVQSVNDSGSIDDNAGEITREPMPTNANIIANDLSNDNVDGISLDEERGENVQSVNDSGNNDDNAGEITPELMPANATTIANDSISGQNDVISNGDDFAELREVTYELMPGKRANSEILYSKEEQQFYVKKKKLANGIVSLVCRTDGCNNHCYLDKEKNTCTLPVPYVPHSHPTGKEEYEKLCVLNKIKSDCANPNIVAKRETKTSVVKSIFKEKIEENEDSTIQYHRVERTLRRIASKTMPAAPKTIDEIEKAFGNEHVNRLYGQTKHQTDTEKNQFYRTTHVTDEFGYTIFASQRCIDLIEFNYPASERRYCMDATFKVVPRLFYQLFIIYVETPTKQVKFLFILINSF